MSRTHSRLQAWMSPAAAIAVVLTAVSAANAGDLTYHYDAGAALASFVGSTKPNQWLRFEFDPAPGSGSASITASNLSFSSDWSVNLFGISYNDASATLFPSPSATLFNDGSGSSYNNGGDTSNFAQIPVDTFGTSLSFDLTETDNSGVGAPTDFVVYAQDDLVKLLDLRFTPGDDTAMLISDASGSTIDPTGGTPALNFAAAPEPGTLPLVGAAGLAALPTVRSLARRRRRSGAAALA